MAASSLTGTRPGSLMVAKLRTDFWAEIQPQSKAQLIARKCVRSVCDARTMLKCFQRGAWNSGILNQVPSVRNLVCRLCDATQFRPQGRMALTEARSVDGFWVCD